MNIRVGLIVCLTTLVAFDHNLGTLLLFEFIFIGVRYASDLPLYTPGRCSLQEAGQFFLLSISLIKTCFL
jgi:cell division protein FtsW (lipid II flippase)